MLTGPQILASNLTRVREQIAAAARAAGRDPSEITLIGVTKGHSGGAARAALAAGLTDFGENFVQEAAPKLLAVDDQRAVWHFIGKLQSNKTLVVAEHFDWVHTIDRSKITGSLMHFGLRHPEIFARMSMGSYTAGYDLRWAPGGPRPSIGSTSSRKKTYDAFCSRNSLALSALAPSSQSRIDCMVTFSSGISPRWTRIRPIAV